MNIRKKKKQFFAVVVTLAFGMAALAAAPMVSSATLPQHGSIVLDTANYIMAPGNQYDIGLTIKDGNGNSLSDRQVNDLVSSGKLKVRDSRTGSVAHLKQLPNGNFRVIGMYEGTCYILYEIGGTHASVRIDVKKGVKQHGTAVRNTSYLLQDVGISTNTNQVFTDPYGRYQVTIPEGFTTFDMGGFSDGRCIWYSFESLNQGKILELGAGDRWFLDGSVEQYLEECVAGVNGTVLTKANQGKGKVWTYRSPDGMLFYQYADTNKYVSFQVDGNESIFQRLSNSMQILI